MLLILKKHYKHLPLLKNNLLFLIRRLIVLEYLKHFPRLLQVIILSLFVIIEKLEVKGKVRRRNSFMQK